MSANSEVTGEPRAPHDTAAAATLDSGLTGLPPAAEQSPPGPGAGGLRLVCVPPQHHPRCAGTGPGCGRRPPPSPFGGSRPQASAPGPRPPSAPCRAPPSPRDPTEVPPLSPQRLAGHCHPLGTLPSRLHPLSARLGTAVPSGIPLLLSSPQRPSPQDQVGFLHPLSATLSPHSPWQPFEAPFVPSAPYSPSCPQHQARDPHPCPHPLRAPLSPLIPSTPQGFPHSTSRPSLQPHPSPNPILCAPQQAPRGLFFPRDISPCACRCAAPLLLFALPAPTHSSSSPRGPDGHFPLELHTLCSPALPSCPRTFLCFTCKTREKKKSPGKVAAEVTCEPQPRHHVLHAFAREQAWAVGQNMACRPLGEEADQSSYIRV